MIIGEGTFINSWEKPHKEIKYVSKDFHTRLTAGVCFCSLLVGGIVGFILGTVL